jgi:hypothetical protein
MKDWSDLKAFALGLELPEVEETTSWGNPVLKAHGKLWTWWSPYAEADAPLFKVEPEEREFLLEHRSDCFFLIPHYAPHNLVLMRAEAFDAEWARANLKSVWRKQAPKRFLKQWDSEQGETS